MGITSAAFQGKPHSPALWLAWFAEACAVRSTHPPRMEIIRQTRQCVSDGCYTNEAGVSVPLDGAAEAQKGTKSYRAGDGAGGAAAGALKVSVRSQDCVETAMSFEGPSRVAILNMAAPAAPGLGPHGAQEENLHRRSTLRLCTSGRGDLYPIPVDGCLFHPGVVFFRGAEAKGYPYLPAARRFDVVSVAAVRRRNKCVPWTDEDNEATRAKVHAVLAACAAEGVECVVLSALGCGAFHNPPEEVAQVFKEVLEAGVGGGSLREVVFAVLEDHNSGGVNGKVFAEVFGVPLMEG